MHAGELRQVLLAQVQGGVESLGRDHRLAGAAQFVREGLETGIHFHVGARLGFDAVDSRSFFAVFKLWRRRRRCGPLELFARRR